LIQELAFKDRIKNSRWSRLFGSRVKSSLLGQEDFGLSLFSLDLV